MVQWALNGRQTRSPSNDECHHTPNVLQIQWLCVQCLPVRGHVVYS